MRFLFPLFLFFTLNLQAEVVQSLESFNCEAFVRDFVINGQKQECQDERYAEWQRNGCYKIEIYERGELTDTFEMVRNVPFHLEVHQKFYSMYVFDKKEWVLRSLILDLEPREEGNEYNFQFDTREARRGLFESTRGFCKSVVK